MNRQSNISSTRAFIYKERSQILVMNEYNLTFSIFYHTRTETITVKSKK